MTVLLRIASQFGDKTRSRGSPDAASSRDMALGDGQGASARDASGEVEERQTASVARAESASYFGHGDGPFIGVRKSPSARPEKPRWGFLVWGQDSSLVLVRERAASQTSTSSTR
jgi:hypothetical protein